jgi:hypothetical protein
MSTFSREVFDTTHVAHRFGVSRDCVVAVVDRLSLGHRIGRNRAILAEDLEQIELGLRAAGYLKPARQEEASS